MMMKTGVILCVLAVSFQFASCIPVLSRPEPIVDGSSLNSPEMMMGKPSEAMDEPYTNMTIDQLIMQAYGGSANDMHPEDLEDENSKLAELDMVLTKDQFLAMYGSQTRREKRKAVRNTVYRWANRVMPYELAPQHFSSYDIQTIKFAMDEWQTRTCLKFRQATRYDKNKVRFQNGYGCNSQLGMVGGTQDLNLQSPSCRWRGLYLHEIGHAIGLVHEHQLPDRDNYINIVWNNVQPSFRIWFKTYKPEALNRHGVSYDLSSIMHYGITAFSKDGRSQTIRTRDPSKESQIGQVWKKELTFDDVKIVNRMYGCSDHCPKNIKCGEDGYIDKHCKCVCPDGSATCRDITGGDKCYDKHKTHYCQYWAEEGECEKSAKWMKENCKMSCKICKSTKPVECKDAHTSKRACKLWAGQGKCEENAKWMIPNCRLSCGRCTPGATTTTSKPGITTISITGCQDIYHDKQACRRWAGSGECEINAEWMIPNCRKSCGKCATITTSSATTTTEPPTTPITTTQTQPPDCEDIYHDKQACRSWASRGECEINAEWMIPNCRKSCGKCAIITTSSATTTTEPTTTTSTTTTTTTASTTTTTPTTSTQTQPPVCEDTHYDKRACRRWANRGECEINAEWMIPNCRKSCGKCTTISQTPPPVNCRNRYNDQYCNYYNKIGECTRNPNWMHKYCKKACGLCENADVGGQRIHMSPNLNGECVNSYPDDRACEQWANVGECQRVPEWMATRCERSCAIC